MEGNANECSDAYYAAKTQKSWSLEIILTRIIQVENQVSKWEKRGQI